ncbi:uncharacterized protein [Primulina eburnea]|uniref:uncharacterized protein n=1 Tax=Primulina eburnea TaxID=1245227 RepID=UPI003C6C0C21
MSDHSPILLQLEANEIFYAARWFRFENSWLRDAELYGIVKSSWSGARNTDMISKLCYCAGKLDSWGRNRVVSFSREIRSCMNRLHNLHDRVDHESVQQYDDIKNKLSYLFIQQEDYWQQRAKAYCLRDGDSNFHAAASMKKKNNTITKFRDDNDNYHEDIDEICWDYLKVPGNWSRLWQLKITPKMKMFLWQAC